MTYNVKMMIKNETEKDNTAAATIAKLMGYKDRNTLYKFLNEPERSCLKFAGLVAVVKEYFGDVEFNVMTDYAKSLPTYSKETARCLLEYANINRLDELQAYMINKMSSPIESSTENRDWAKVYQLDIDMQNGTEGILDVINTFNSRFPEVVAYKNILKMYYYYDNQHISMLKEHLLLSESSISNIKVSAKSDEYIKNSYENRVNLALMGSYISNGEFEECMKLSEKVIKKNPEDNIKIVAYLQMGNAYMFESYEKAMNSFEKGLNLAMMSTSPSNSNYTIQIKRSINFLNVYWNKQVSFITDAGTVAEINNTIHNLINKGNLEKAQILLEEIDYESTTMVSKGFYKYYESIIKETKASLYESIMNFKSAGKLNYCQLPLLKLKSLGENDLLLKALVG